MLFNLKSKTTLITAILAAFFLLSYMNSGEAIEIAEFGPTNDSSEATRDYNRYLEHTEYVKTDEPYSRVEWYVDNQLRETTSSDGIKTEANFNPYFLIGSYSGTDHVIKVIVYQWNGEESDTDSFTLTVFISPFEILEMRPYNWSFSEYVDLGYENAYHLAYVRTNAPIYTIDWYLNGAYAGSSSGESNSSTFEATFSFDSLSGDITGTTYEIKAVARPIDGDPEGIVTDTDTYTLTVFKPLRAYVQGSKTDVWAYLEISKQHHVHPYISTGHAAYGSNPLDEDDVGRRFSTRYVTVEFLHTVNGPNVNTSASETFPREKLRSLSTSPYQSNSSLTCSIALGRPGREYTSRAYTKVEVDGAKFQNPDAVDLLELISVETFIFPSQAESSVVFRKLPIHYGRDTVPFQFKGG